MNDFQILLILVAVVVVMWLYLELCDRVRGWTSSISSRPWPRCSASSTSCGPSCGPRTS